jgi:glycerol-3-phosphate acyltransferase PlsY
MRIAAIPILALVTSLAGYLLGSIPFGLILTKIFGGGDVRTAGSGNIGATNVARVAGPIAGVATLILDAAKGSGAVLLAARFAGDSTLWMMVAGLCALAGHCFPLWLKFHGGKGVATAAGVFLVMSPLAVIGAILVFLVVVVVARYVSLGSISAAAAMPVLVYFLPVPHAPLHIVLAGALAAALLIVYKHDKNIRRLVKGEEPKFSFAGKKAAA